MNTFTKTLIASAMAVAVAGTASADPKFTGVYAGSKTNLKVNPSGCPNANPKNQTTAVGFAPGFFEWDDLVDFYEVNIPFAGCWRMAGLGGIISDIDDFDALDGTYIERKVGKDLTMAMTRHSLDDVVDAMDLHLETEPKCDVAGVGGGVDGVIPSSVIVKKANGKLSKNGERVKLDLQVDAKYKTDDNKEKNIKATIKGKMDYNPSGDDELFTCDNVLTDCGDDVCID